MGFIELTGAWTLALGKTVLHSIWMGLLVLALLRMVLSLVPSRLSGLRYHISVSALLILFFSVFAAFLLIFEPEASVPGIPDLQGVESGTTETGPLAGKATALLASGLIFTLVGHIYLLGVLFMLFRSLRSLSFLNELQKSGSRPAEEWQEIFFRLCDRLGIKRSVGFLESGRVSAPQLAGFLKPLVIVPAGMLANLPASQIEIILVHELYHIRRKDHLVNLVQLIIESILFYHPGVWFISAIIRSEREHCCDDRVLGHTDNPFNYAKALIQVAEQQHLARLAPGLAGSGNGQLYSRIKRILNQHTMKTNMRDKVLTLTLLAAGLILLLSISGFRAAPALNGISEQNMEMMSPAAGHTGFIIPDTIPDTVPEITPPEEIDLEAIREEVEEARLEALREIKEIDWDAIREDMEEARLEVLREIEEIDWETFRKDMEEAREEALREIEEIDWETFRKDMEEAREEALREIEEVDWEAIREEVRISIDSLRIEMDR